MCNNECKGCGVCDPNTHQFKAQNYLAGYKPEPQIENEIGYMEHIKPEYAEFDCWWRDTRYYMLHCEKCQIWYYKQLKEEHIELRHPPYKCDCGFRTRNKAELKKHQSTHKEKKPQSYDCEPCNYHTKRSDDFKKHLDTKTHKKVVANVLS